VNPSDSIRAYVRTLVPVAIGVAASFLVAWLAKTAGVTVDGNMATWFVTAATVALVYAAGRWLEKRHNPVLAFLGRFLLSLGADLGQPTYTEPSAAVKTRTGPPPLHY
jgi:hypothetical protein